MRTKIYWIIGIISACILLLTPLVTISQTRENRNLSVRYTEASNFVEFNWANVQTVQTNIGYIQQLSRIELRDSGNMPIFQSRCRSVNDIRHYTEYEWKGHGNPSNFRPITTPIAATVTFENEIQLLFDRTNTLINSNSSQCGDAIDCTFSASDVVINYDTWSVDEYDISGTFERNGMTFSTANINAIGTDNREGQIKFYPRILTNSVDTRYIVVGMNQPFFIPSGSSIRYPYVSESVTPRLVFTSTESQESLRNTIDNWLSELGWHIDSARTDNAEQFQIRNNINIQNYRLYIEYDEVASESRVSIYSLYVENESVVGLNDGAIPFSNDADTSMATSPESIESLGLMFQQNWASRGYVVVSDLSFEGYRQIEDLTANYRFLGMYDPITGQAHFRYMRKVGSSQTEYIDYSSVLTCGLPLSN